MDSTHMHRPSSHGATARGRMERAAHNRQRQREGRAVAAAANTGREAASATGRRVAAPPPKALRNHPSPALAPTEGPTLPTTSHPLARPDPTDAPIEPHADAVTSEKGQ